MSADSVRRFSVLWKYGYGLTKIRDSVTLFILLKRDQGHVGLFSKFCISIGSRLFVVSLSMTSKLRFCPGAFSLMSLMELRTDHSLLKIVCDN